MSEIKTFVKKTMDVVTEAEKALSVEDFEKFLSLLEEEVAVKAEEIQPDDVDNDDPIAIDDYDDWDHDTDQDDEWETDEDYDDG
jgi:hypothetical protein